MSIITKDPVLKGQKTPFILHKENLVTLISQLGLDPYFLDYANWKQVILKFQSTEGNQQIPVVFDTTDHESLTATSEFKLSETARNVFDIQSIFIYDNDNGYIIIPRVSVPVSDFDVDATPVPLDPSIEVIQGTLMSDKILVSSKGVFFQARNASNYNKMFNFNGTTLTELAEGTVGGSDFINYYAIDEVTGDLCYVSNNKIFRFNGTNTVQVPLINGRTIAASMVFFNGYVHVVLAGGGGYDLAKVNGNTLETAYAAWPGQGQLLKSADHLYFAEGSTVSRWDGTTKTKAVDLNGQGIIINSLEKVVHSGNNCYLFVSTDLYGGRWAYHNQATLTTNLIDTTSSSDVSFIHNSNVYLTLYVSGKQRLVKMNGATPEVVLSMLTGGDFISFSGAIGDNLILLARDVDFNTRLFSFNTITQVATKLGMDINLIPRPNGGTSVYNGKSLFPAKAASHASVERWYSYNGTEIVALPLANEGTGNAMMSSNSLPVYFGGHYYLNVAASGGTKLAKVYLP